MITARRTQETFNADCGLNIDASIAHVNSAVYIFIDKDVLLPGAWDLFVEGPHRSASGPFAAVLVERVGVSLPLHVFRGVRASGAQGDDVVSDGARAGTGRQVG